MTCSFLSSNFFDHWIKLVLRNLKGSSWNEHYETQWLHHWFILWEFPVNLQKGFKNIYIFCDKFYVFSPKNPSPKNQKKLPKVVTIVKNMKVCLRFFYFHILNITKFVQIYLWMIITKATSQKTHTHTIGMHSCKGYLFKPKLKIEF